METTFWRSELINLPMEIFKDFKVLEKRTSLAIINFNEFLAKHLDVSVSPEEGSLQANYNLVSPS